MVGHVDHGKTSILDQIRGSSVAASEAGLITQCISCTQIPFDVIKKICKGNKQIDQLKIPGLLLIDTPGHASFTNLRKRGGSLADIAILVIDINEGLKPQTLESIEILKHNKTPFIIAANKMDLIPGFQSKDLSLLQNIESQPDNVNQVLESRLYDIVGKLTEHNLDSERFDRIEDYTKQIAIIPISAKANIGIPELLLTLTGLAQKFLENQLKVDLEKPAKGVVLEIKEEKGLGKTLDVIIYDGKITKKDSLVIAGLEKPLTIKVRTLCQEDKNKKHVSVDEVKAASTLKIIPSDSKGIFAGMPFEVVTDSTKEKIKKEIQEQVEEVLIETDKEGVIVKADSLGSLEALISLLKENKIPIKRASLGNVNKSDLAEATAEENPIYKTILAFNVRTEIETKKTKIILHDVIYQIIDDYQEWKEKETKKAEQEKLKDTIRPGKMVILPGTIFRQNNPAIVGVEILQGSICADCPIMRDDGLRLTNIKSIQVEGENVDKVEKGKQAAISLPNITVGRQIFENFTLYTDVPETDFRKLKEMKNYLNPDEVSLLREIALIKRKKNPLWGV
tara:strand:- start:17629 stop:19323 length:1695 start_codon:yes stop_codon:yes gene_type:complete